MSKLFLAAVCAALCTGNLMADEASAKALAEAIAKDHKVTNRDKFYGFDRVVFEFEGHEAWIVSPSCAPREGKPWTWCMQWAYSFVKRINVPQMLADGYHHVTIDTFEHRMDAEGLRVSAAFQRYLVEKLGFAKKANLIGMSWGGFFSIRYAVNYPDNVGRIYLDAPLLTFYNFMPNGVPEKAAEEMKSWGVNKPADDYMTSPEMPLNMAERLAKLDIPIFMVYNGQDESVPKGTCDQFVNRVRAVRGERDFNVKLRRLQGHHPHGFELDETPIKDFFDGKQLITY